MIPSLTFPRTPMLRLFIMSLPPLIRSLRPLFNILFAIVFGVLVFPFCGIPPEPADQKSDSLGLGLQTDIYKHNLIPQWKGIYSMCAQAYACVCLYTHVLVHTQVCVHVHAVNAWLFAGM